MARKPEVYLTDTIETWRQKTNRLSSNIGDPDDLNTTNKTNLVSAINELASNSNVSFIRDQLSVVTSGGGNHSSLSYDKNSGRFSFVVNTFQASDVPNLDASKITTGVFNVGRIPNLDASKITTGTISLDRLPQSVRDAAGGVGIVNSTDDVTEGVNNLYFTTARARQSIVAGTNITYNPTTGVISATGGPSVDLKVDPDYDIPTDTDNNWLAHSLQSVYFFLDTNNSETGNYFAVYNNLDPYNATVNKTNSIFRVDENGDVNVTGKLNVSTSGIEFPPNSFGGGGDTAKIYLAEASGGSGEATQLTLEVNNDLTDEIRLKTPSDDGVKINGYTVLHEGNLGSSVPNLPIMVEAMIDTIQNSGVYYFTASQYPSGVTRLPDSIVTILVCKIPNNGYLVDDEVYFANSTADPAGAVEGLTITRNANSQLIQTRIGANGPGELIRKNSGAGFVSQSSDWKLKQRFIWFGKDADHTRTITALLTDPSLTSPSVTINGNQVP